MFTLSCNCFIFVRFIFRIFFSQKYAYMYILYKLYEIFSDPIPQPFRRIVESLNSWTLMNCIQRIMMPK